MEQSTILGADDPRTSAQTKTPKKPDNYLPWAILSTLLCCLPFGIVAIIYSAKVDSEWNAGHYDAAIDAAAAAKKWTWIGAGIGISVILLYVIFIACVAFAAATGALN